MQVRIERDANVQTITLCDIDNRNAMSRLLMEQLQRALDDGISDPAVRAIVLTNEGTVFCAGADVREIGEGGRRTDDSDRLVRVLETIVSSPTPVIGRIAGHASGGGVGLVAACDISVAADDVKLGFTEVRLGVTPAIISVVCLPRMRRGDALRTFLRGDRWTAATAAEYGLVTEAVPRDQLDDAVAAVVSDVVLGGPEALAIAKDLVNRMSRVDRAAEFEWTSALSTRLFNSGEAAEGMTAFRERRKPAWAAEA